MAVAYKSWTVCPGCSNLVWDEQRGQLVKVDNVFPPVREKWCRLCFVTWVDSGDDYPPVKK
jgi:hypothetical protein